MDVVEPCDYSVEKGGGLEEGGLEIDPDRRDADSFFMFFRCRFLVCFREVFLSSLFQVFVGSGRSYGHHFRSFFRYFTIFS